MAIQRFRRAVGITNGIVRTGPPVEKYKRVRFFRNGDIYRAIGTRDVTRCTRASGRYKSIFRRACATGVPTLYASCAHMRSASGMWGGGAGRESFPGSHANRPGAGWGARRAPCAQGKVGFSSSAAERAARGGGTGC